MKKRKIRTLSTNIQTGAVGRPSVPAPASPPKIKRQVEINTDEEEPVDVVEIDPIKYKSADIIDEFKKYNLAYFEIVKEQVLRHQALRTAISQVGNVTSKEFNAAFMLLDTETDEALSQIFKFNFLATIVDDLNSHSHQDTPLDLLEVCRILFFPDVPAPKTKEGFDSKKLVEQLKKLIKVDPVGPYGINGNRNDKTKP